MARACVCRACPVGVTAEVGTWERTREEGHEKQRVREGKMRNKSRLSTGFQGIDQWQQIWHHKKDVREKTLYHKVWATGQSPHAALRSVQ